MRHGVQVLKTPFHPIFRRLLLREKNFGGLHLKPFYSVIQQRKHGSFYQGAEQINNNSAFLQIKKRPRWMESLPKPSASTESPFVSGDVFSCLLLSLFLILEGNKLIGMLHGLKKLIFFSPLQTHAKSQVMKGLQLRDRIPLSFVLLLPLLFTETVPVAFFGFPDVLFWGIVYLLSQKLVWIIPDPTCSTQTAPKKNVKKVLVSFFEQPTYK